MPTVQSQILSIDQEYSDVLAILRGHGYDAGIADTGGGCEAIEISLKNDSRLLVTDKDELLAWDRADHHGWGVGLYDSDGEMVCYRDTDDGSAEGLLAVVLDAIGGI
ncbi:hypothetical protein ACWDXV_16630 [Nocardia nova]